MLRFVIMLIPLSFILRKTGYGYEVGEDGQTINPLLLMDYVKLSGKNRTGVAFIGTGCQNSIRMSFVLEKCGIFKAKRGNMGK